MRTASLYAARKPAGEPEAQARQAHDSSPKRKQGSPMTQSPKRERGRNIKRRSFGQHFEKGAAVFEEVFADGAGPEHADQKNGGGGAFRLRQVNTHLVPQKP